MAAFKAISQDAAAVAAFLRAGWHFFRKKKKRMTTELQAILCGTDNNLSYECSVVFQAASP